MKLDLPRFFDSCDPSRTLIIEKPEDRQYYIDFASVRGGNVIAALERTITRLSPDKPTCQLFTGHIGCGKSTELRRLEAELKLQGFHVVYFESTQDLDMTDVDVTDIMLAIARQVSESLEVIGVKVKPGYFTNLLNEIIDFLQTPIELKESPGSNLKFQQSADLIKVVFDKFLVCLCGLLGIKRYLVSTDNSFVVTCCQKNRRHL